MFIVPFPYLPVKQIPFIYEKAGYYSACAFTAQTVQKQTGQKHPAWREAPGMAGCRYSSTEG